VLTRIKEKESTEKRERTTRMVANNEIHEYEQ
jgi:hypothetical protein